MQISIKGAFCNPLHISDRDARQAEFDGNALFGKWGGSVT